MDVGDDADDFGFAMRLVDDFTQRVFFHEIASRQRFVDQNDMRGVFPVAVFDHPSPQQRDFHGLEVLLGRRPDIGTRLLSGSWWVSNLRW